MDIPTKVEPKPDVKIVPSETVASSPEVVIDTTTGKPAETVTQTTPSVDQGELERKLSARFNYELRQSQKQIRELNEKIASLSQGKPTKVENSDGQDEIEQIAQTDWKRAVSMLAEKQTKEAIKAYQEQQARETQERTFKDSIVSLDQRSKEKVLKEFPDLVDEDSETTKKYMGVWNREILEDPTFLNNPRKYEIVAAQIRGETKSSNPEVERLKRVAAGSVNSNRSVQSSNRIILTQDEIDLCDKSGIPYATYERNKKRYAQGSFKDGLELKS